jgi:hypothetical protein
MYTEIQYHVFFADDNADYYAVATTLPAARTK